MRSASILAGLRSALSAMSGIRFKILGIVLGLIFIFGFGMKVQMGAMLADALGEQMNWRLVSVARDLEARSVDYVLTGNVLALHGLTQDTLANNPDIRYVFIMDRKGRLLAHTFEEGFPYDLVEANPVGAGDRFRLELLETEEGTIRDVAVPIFNGIAGVVRVGLREEVLEQALARMRQRILAATVIVSMGGLLVAYLLTALLTRPVRQLVEVTRAVAAGDLQREVTITSRDEIGLLASAFRTMADHLQRKEAIRNRLLAEVISAQEEERKRIARELHDQTGQSLASLMVGLRTLEGVSDPRSLREKTATLRTLIAATLEDVRNLALELRPSALDDLGLVPALERYVRDFGYKMGLEAELHVHGFAQRRLPGEVETAIYRIVQEAMTNVAKHARATSVKVALERVGDTVTAIVRDDGRGFDVEEVVNSEERYKRLGLHGMEERAALIGGTLVVDSRPGAGTSIMVKVPVSQEGVTAGDGPGLDRQQAPDDGDEISRRRMGGVDRTGHIRGEGLEGDHEVSRGETAAGARAGDGRQCVPDRQHEVLRGGTRGDGTDQVAGG